MAYISLEKLMKKGKTSLYKLVLMAASRANDLAQGAKPLVDTKTNKVTTLALEEIAQGKVGYEDTKPKGKGAAA